MLREQEAGVPWRTCAGSTVLARLASTSEFPSLAASRGGPKRLRALATSTALSSAQSHCPGRKDVILSDLAFSSSAHP